MTRTQLLPDKTIFVIPSQRRIAMRFEVETEGCRFRLYIDGQLLKSKFAMGGWYKTQNQKISMHDEWVQRTVQRMIEDSHWM